MQFFHDKFYPEGTSIQTKDYYGVNIKGPKYENAAAMVGGYSACVSTPAELKAAVAAARKSLEAGKTAILNVMMPDQGNLR
jgi:thiamine pyrophosphate-dependent acetolactate synthase large subunit-like protein